MSDVPAARQVLGILSYLARQPRPVPARAIARDLGLPRSTTYHLLHELESAGFVVHLPDERRYGLGVAAYELGSGYLRQEPLQRLARVPLSALTDQTGHSSHLAILHGREVLYVIEERAPGRMPLVTDVGVRLPAQLTASGRAMLAGLPAAAVRALFPGPGAFVLRNSRGPRTLRDLRALLAEVRRRGYATEDGEVTEGLASVAAAVTDHSGHPVASVALTFPDSALVPRFAAPVMRAAAEITRRIGGSLRAGPRRVHPEDHTGSGAWEGSMRISNLLRAKGTQVVTVTPDTKVRQLLAVLAEHRIGAAVVSRDGTAVDGIVSERDVVQAFAARGAAVMSDEVTAIYTAQVFTVTPETSTEEVMRMMTEHRVRHAPVVVDGGLRGIVSIGDVVKNRMDELETERTALAEYITTSR